MTFTKLYAALCMAVPLAMSHPYKDDIYSHWKPAGPGDARAPCPMLNTMANHQFLPHNGRNITRDRIIYALSTALNFDPEVINLTFDQAITANPQPNATWFDLDHLSRPDVLEHDASLSRQDVYFGNNFLFDPAIFEETKKFWHGDVLDRFMLTNSKVGRQLQSKVSNPTYTFTEKTEGFSNGEVTSLVIAFGDWESMTVPRKFIEYWFENEQLPTSLGWEKPKEPVTRPVIQRFDVAFTNAQSLYTDADGNPVALATEDVD